MTIKSLIKKLVPKGIFKLYHLTLAWGGAIYYGHPSKKMMIIGVTGTRGKTSTSNFIWAALTAAGYKVGQTGTANIRIGNVERLNPYHMTMPGRATMQKLLSQMVKAGCEIAVIETPSEGVEQFRHKGIAYDIMVFTVLFPEHLEIHNWDPERCTQKMIEPFAELMRQPRKQLRGKDVLKTIIVNRDSDGYERFLNNPAEKRMTFAVKGVADLVAKDIAPTDHGVSFMVGLSAFRLNIPGSFNAPNALPAIAIAREIGIPDVTIERGFNSLHTIPGRMEEIKSGQPFKVFVDYAHDGPSISALLHAAKKFKRADGKIIIVVGAEGGGRDKEKRPVMGKLCAELADIVIVTNVDPYEDDPQEILNDISEAAQAVSKKINSDLFVIADRRKGIRKALDQGNPGDIILVTGKGAEQSMEIGGHSIPWDDRKVVREELSRISNI